MQSPPAATAILNGWRDTIALQTNGLSYFPGLCNFVAGAP